MKRDTIAPTLPPYTSEEEAALAEKLKALTQIDLAHYIEAAKNSLNNTSLAPSWRPRVELGLKIAQGLT
jgi:hypothetical protein